ncbi:MAG: hypothetical protein LIP09_13190 [Bacteroidales bacterium]|nr:hypothetical protein [Bacteroidales bacterium]
MRKFLLLVISLMTVSMALATVTKHASTTIAPNKMVQKATAAPIAKGEAKGIIKAEQILNATTTERTITLRNGKTITSRISTLDIKSLSRVSRSEEEITPLITFTYPDEEGMVIMVSNATLYRIDGESGFTVGNSYEYNPESVELYWGVEPGSYIAVSTGIWEREESFGTIYAHTYVDITADTESINIDFSKCTNEITMKMEMPDGSLFPEMDFETGEGTDATFTFSGFGISASMWTYTSSMVALADNFDEGVTYTCQCLCSDFENFNIICGEAAVYSPFSGNIEGTLTADKYKSTSQEFCISEAEKSYNQGGFSFATSSSQGTSTMNLLREGIFPPTLVTLQYAQLESDDISGFALGSIYGYNEDTWNFYTKMGGTLVDYQGESVFIPCDTRWTQEDGTYSIVPTVDALIHPVAKVADPLFYCPLLPSASIMLWYYEEDNTIAEISLGMGLMGAANESTNPTDVLGCLKGARYNGEEIEPADLIGKEIWGSKYEFDFEDSEFLMMNEYSFKAASTIGFELPGTDAEDTQNPNIVGYSMADANGYITPEIKPGEAGTFAVVTYDMNDYWMQTTDYTVEFALRANGSEEWISVPCDEETDELSGYRTSTVNLGVEELEEDTFYDVQVTATDAAGNFIKSSISPAFYYGANLGIAKVESNGDVVSSTYVDLLGRPASANTQGMLIRTDRLSDGTTRTVKVINR